jgi:hypothetical protein
MLFPTCVRSLIFSDKDDDSFCGGKEEQGSSVDSGQEAPSTTILSVRSEVMVYEPATSHLAYDLNNPAQTRAEADSATCQIEPISGELLTDLNVSSRLSLWRTTEPPASQGRSRRDPSQLSNSLDSDTIELPSIPQEWKCYSKTRTDL